jgi:hypothetical protein
MEKLEVLSGGLSWRRGEEYFLLDCLGPDGMYAFWTDRAGERPEGKVDVLRQTS